MVEPEYDTKELENVLYRNEYHDINKMPWYRIINNELLLGRNKKKITFNIPPNSDYKRNQYIDYICNKQGYIDIKLSNDTKIFIYYEGQHKGVDINNIDIDIEPLKMSVCNHYSMNDFYVDSETRVIVDIRYNVPNTLSELLLSFAYKYCKQVIVFN